MTRTSSKIIGIYLTIGVLWILISDWAFDYFGYPENPMYQTIKGIGFILISGMIFLIMLRNYEFRNDDYLARQKATADKLRLANERYTKVSKATNSIIWDWDLKKNKVLWAKNLTVLLGYDSLYNDPEWWTDRIHPEDQERVIAKVRQFLESGQRKKWSDEYRIVHADGNVRYIYDRAYLMFDKKGRPIRMIGSMEDLTERKTSGQQLEILNDQIRKRAEELAISNAELEQFAYIASHDLQEPLRMVTGFLTQLEKKYDPVLDDKGKQYIHFAVDGAVRMRKIILDLLEYSKVGKTAFHSEKIDTNELVDDIIKLNKTLLDEQNVTVRKANLPVIFGGKTLIQQVFQNLIVNAIKYRKADENPLIAIGATEDENFWQFSVSDNGIGIDPDYFEKIFVLFQRLHNKEEYSGTGIGLSICKKIVENHGGKIWVASGAQKGSVFYFTIKK